MQFPHQISLIYIAAKVVKGIKMPIKPEQEQECRAIEHIMFPFFQAKCEEYWPPFSKPCLYGELLVTTTSEQEESNWTLREFTVTHVGRPVLMPEDTDKI